MADQKVGSERVIRVMPEALANKIAAGEVVQRPASVAKELIENALDAGAGAVTLVLKKSGRELIQVIDDGCGMSAADARACFRRHATSKIRSIQDLERLQTLGFRGEALASIAAVAQVELKTKRVEDGAGTRVRIEGGEQVKAGPCAAPGGTSVAVRNLFYNVPVRRNFLKTPATEFKHLAETFQFLALANPSVAFTLVHNGNEVYRLAPGRGAFEEALRERIAGLFGEDRARALLRVEDASSYLSVHGFAGRPEQHRRSRDEQFLFVNERYVEDRYLAHAVKTAYGNLLPEGTFPFFALFLRLDPRRVDVNVHPTKAEVKFEDQSGVYGFLREAVRQALRAQDLTPQFERKSFSDEEAPVAFEAVPQKTGGSFRTHRREASSRRSEATTSPAVRRSAASGDRAPGAYSERLYAPPRPGEAPEELPAADDEAESTERAALWQVQGRYIVTTSKSGLLVIDQHAAHKRVLYERALRRLEQGSGTTQQLLFPQTVEVAPADASLLEELLPELRALGFDLELFSGRTVAVRGAPAEVREGEAPALLEDLLAQFRANRRELHLKKPDSLARSLAGRSAIRAGRRLSTEEMQALVADLFRCEMPYADPQGRPTTVTLSAEELAGLFEA